MRLSELIEELEYIQENLDGDPQIFLAEQSKWPFQYSINGVHQTSKGIYIEEGQQLDYLNSEVKEEIGW